MNSNSSSTSSSSLPGNISSALGRLVGSGQGALDNSGWNDYQRQATDAASFGLQQGMNNMGQASYTAHDLTGFWNPNIGTSQASLTTLGRGNVRNVDPAQASLTTLGRGSVRNVDPAQASMTTFNRGSVRDIGADQIGAQDVRAGTLPGVDLSRYMNPYIQNVVNSSMGELNRQGDIDQQRLNGNAALSGAFGGDRAAITNAEAVRNLQQTKASTLGSLYSQGYNTATGLAQTDLSRQLQAAGMNQQAGLQASTANQNANLAAARSNQGADLTVGGQNASTANQLAQYNAGLRQQAAASNQGADISVGQLNTNSANQSAQYNAGLRQQAATANQGMDYQVGQLNTNSANQMSEYNANLAHQAQVANQQNGLSGAALRLNAANSLGNLGYQWGAAEGGVIPGIARAGGGRIPGMALGGTLFHEGTALQELPLLNLAALARIYSSLPYGSLTTQTQTHPGPSALAQGAGLSATIAGLLGQSGAFGKNGWLWNNGSDQRQDPWTAAGSSPPTPGVKPAEFSNAGSDQSGDAYYGDTQDDVDYAACGGRIGYDRGGNVASQWHGGRSMPPAAQGQGHSPAGFHGLTPPQRGGASQGPPGLPPGMDRLPMPPGMNGPQQAHPPGLQPLPPAGTNKLPMPPGMNGPPPMSGIAPPPQVPSGMPGGAPPGSPPPGAPPGMSGLPMPPGMNGPPQGAMPAPPPGLQPLPPAGTGKLPMPSGMSGPPPMSGIAPPPPGGAPQMPSGMPPIPPGGPSGGPPQMPSGPPPLPPGGPPGGFARGGIARFADGGETSPYAGMTREQLLAAAQQGDTDAARALQSAAPEPEKPYEPPIKVGPLHPENLPWVGPIYEAAVRNNAQPPPNPYAQMSDADLMRAAQQGNTEAAQELGRRAHETAPPTPAPAPGIAAEPETPAPSAAPRPGLVPGQYDPNADGEHLAIPPYSPLLPRPGIKPPQAGIAAASEPSATPPPGIARPMARPASLPDVAQAPVNGATPPSVGAPSAARPRSGIAAAPYEPDVWMPLAQAGAAMMASQSPFALSALGEGAQAGLKGYQEQRQLAATLGLKRAQMDLNERKLKNAEDATSGRNKYFNDKLDVMRNKPGAAPRVQTAADGTSYTVNAQGKAVPLLDTDGKPVMGHVPNAQQSRPHAMTAVQTDHGLMLFDPNTGKLEPATANGQTLQRTSPTSAQQTAMTPNQLASLRSRIELSVNNNPLIKAGEKKAMIEQQYNSALTAAGMHPQQAPAPQQGQPLPQGYTAQRALSEAQAALAAGAPRAGVIARLQQYGIDPAGL